MEKSDIKIFTATNGNTAIEVKLDKETVWLNQLQLAELFHTERSAINKHILNIYNSKELKEKSTCAKIAQVQKEGNREVNRKIKYYNLDLIISVGYRVNSKRGTEFRIWATQLLNEYLVKGYTLNEKKLKESNVQLNELKDILKIISETTNQKRLTGDESQGLLKIISDYTYALDILDKYDYQTLTIENTSGKETYQLTYKEAIKQIEITKKAYGNSELFGREKDK